ncbi:uncharacterized protein GLRG_00428 [Colletotrichum graminicola M1.001]|uniref:Uncharacterized protein n=1 Tax=Colletotrichum graminicola (strain M1.001 / M2 / FGSC 10212) TaxID=645133 RepID=E3Q2I3_COLGM|nr:uncharacterized protein GLRG_00428 [Colletotrichum graminicola M1.001]EFQ25284.1 hypothetical protein GLRG_00428 [Colletotrichum graminicola M1.001]
MAPHAVPPGRRALKRRARPANIAVSPSLWERDAESDDEYANQVRNAAGGVWKRTAKSGIRPSDDTLERRSDSDSGDRGRGSQYSEPSSPDTPKTRPSYNLPAIGRLPVASLRPALPAVSNLPSTTLPAFEPAITSQAPVLEPPMFFQPVVPQPRPTSHMMTPYRPLQPVDPQPAPVLAPADPESTPRESEVPIPPATMTVTSPPRTITVISTMKPASSFDLIMVTLSAGDHPIIDAAYVSSFVDRPGYFTTFAVLTATLASAALPAETLSALPGPASAVSDRGGDDGRPSRMNPETEHALIAVGSIGSFIFASFLVWIVWRTMKKASRRRRERELGYPNDRPGIGSKIPFFKGSMGGWQNIDGRQSDPTQYEKGPRGTLRLDTGFYGPNGKPANYGPGGTYVPNYMSPVDSRGSPIHGSPTGALPVRMNPMNGGTYNGQQGVFNSQTGTYTSQVGTFSSQTGTYVSHAPSGSLTHIIGQYGNGTEPGMTLRSGVGAGAYFNQSELARQPSDAYDPARRQVNRASELSSISSGFGDGDIIVPGMPGMVLQPPPPVSQSLRASRMDNDRVSWANKSNRETVYTEASEDLPPRFRTVDSWVNQQSGRVKRAQARPQTDEDIPPVPGLPAGTGQNGMPPEPQFTMMMPDGEVPRRPDNAS